MGFRHRLTAFFVGIVLIPMLALALIVHETSQGSAEGKADARLSASLATAKALYDRGLRTASDEAGRIASAQHPEGTVADAIGREDAAALEAIARRELDGVVAVSIYGPGRERLAGAGPADGIALSRRQLVGPDGEVLGAVEVAALEPTSFTTLVGRLTEGEVAIVSAGETVAATPALEDAAIAAGEGASSIELPGGEGRAAGLALDGAPQGSRLVVAIELDRSWLASSPLLIAGLLAFLALALVCIFFVIRQLQQQVASMLAAARRIGSGDFSTEVPVVGNDEMAELACEFNKMSDRLEEQMSELTHQREQLDQSVRRLGTALASGLDRAALLEIVVEGAVVSCGAESGRVSLLDQIDPEAVAGTAPDADLAEALEQASRRSIERDAPTQAEVAGAHAISIPLAPPGEQRTVLGTMALARHGERFSKGECEVLQYLVGQAEVSIQNIGAHERVTELAATDDLTGLSNNRHFREWMTREVSRANRFESELSLVILDIDDFKSINDTYGHQQGDAVIEQIGRVLRMESRGIDEPARYGGEEFVLGLPETPSDGAELVAERVRESLEEMEIDSVNGGPPLRVTASLGVATMPADGTDLQTLFAAADEALYAAKRGGKNRVVVAART
jgi:diguanylate cyclase (GGDEF)-like protein